MSSFDFTFDAGANPPTLISAESTLPLAKGEQFLVNMTVINAAETPALIQWRMTFDSGTNPIEGHETQRSFTLAIPSPPTGTYFSDTLAIATDAATGQDSYVLSANIHVGESSLHATSTDPIIEVTDG